MGLLYRKVGRLYPGKDDQVHVVRDESGESGVVSREEMREIMILDHHPLRTWPKKIKSPAFSLFTNRRARSFDRDFWHGDD